MNNTDLPFKAIVFDLDGTLIDSTSTIINGYNYALNPFGIQVTLQDIEAMRSHTADELFRDRLSKNDAKIAVDALHDYSIRAAEHTILLPGVKSLLNNLGKLNVNVGLWTGRDRSSALQIIKHHCIDHHFEEVVACCDVKKNKPDGEGLLLLANTLNIKPTEMVHIGDHEHDLIGATQANATAVHVRWSHEKRSDEYHPLSHFTFDSMNELSLWLTSF